MNDNNQHKKARIIPRKSANAALPTQTDTNINIELAR